jgi:hypothetical protein
MTTAEQSTPRSGRTRTLQDDLLEDLRRAAPMPAAAPAADLPVLQPAERPGPADPETPTLELRVTPRRWTAPSARLLGGSAFVIGAGPVRLCVTGFCGGSGGRAGA